MTSSDRIPGFPYHEGESGSPRGLLFDGEQGSQESWHNYVITIRDEVFFMQGIQYVTDEKGQKVAVQINLRKFGEIWEDFFDNLLSKQRAEEPRESIESVRERLRKQGKLHV